MPLTCSEICTPATVGLVNAFPYPPAAIEKERVKRDVDVRRMAERGENARMRVRVNIVLVLLLKAEAGERKAVLDGTTISGNEAEDERA